MVKYYFYCSKSVYDKYLEKGKKKFNLLSEQRL